MFNSPTNWDGTDVASTLWRWLGPMVLAAAVAGAAVHLSAPGRHARATPIGTAAGLAVMVLPLVVLAAVPSGNEVFPWFMSIPSMLATLGWGLLAGGLVSVGLLAVDPVRASLVRLVLACVVPAATYWAYQRPGGAPEVPGWDFSDFAVVLTVPLATTLVAGAIVGVVLRLARQWDPHGGADRRSTHGAVQASGTHAADQGRTPTPGDGVHPAQVVDQPRG